MSESIKRITHLKVINSNIELLAINFALTKRMRHPLTHSVVHMYVVVKYSLYIKSKIYQEDPF